MGEASAGALLAEDDDFDIATEVWQTSLPESKQINITVDDYPRSYW